MRRHLLLLLLFLILHATFSIAAGDGGGCQRLCNGGAVPYPFGFSGDCPILLICNATTSTALLPHSNATAAYPILSFNSTASTFLALLDPSCNRTVAAAAASLAGAGGYGVSSRTGLFLRGGASCRPQASSNCTVPADLMTRLLRTAQCRSAGGGNDTAWTCVASVPPAPGSVAAASGRGQFMAWEMVNGSGCEDALTAAVYGDTQQGVPSLQFGVAELGWWLAGNCTGGGHPCAANATCRDVQTPSGAWGHRCACPDGMAGDGFAAGDGCRHSASQPSKKNIPLIVAGVLSGLVAAAAVLLLCRLQRRRSAAGRYGAAMRLLSEAASSSGVPVYSYHEVARATNGFSHTHRLGTGAYGTVYVGKLPAAASAPLVAIKRLRCHRHHHHEDDGDEGEAAAALLLNEIKLISSVSHPGLVRLLGCCLDRGEQILVYEYVPNGTLSQHLHGGNGNGGAGDRGSRRLPWRARLGIVDPALVVGEEDEWVMDSVRHVSELAFRCLAFQKDVRPCMSEVAAELGRIRAAAPDSDSGSGLGPMTDLQIDVSFGNPDTVVKKAASPVSVQEVWVSDRSSPSTNGSSLFMPRFV
ncbi:hypothetical protein EJB05_55578, partial [Eragrostis curvula]